MTHFPARIRSMVVQHAAVVGLPLLVPRLMRQAPGALTPDMEAAVARMTREAERAGVPADRARRAAVATQLVAASLAGAGRTRRQHPVHL
jgi:hypothetical protein